MKNYFWGADFFNAKYTVAYIVAGRAPILPLDRHLFPALCKSTRPTFLFPMKQYIRRYTVTACKQSMEMAKCTGHVIL